VRDIVLGVAARLGIDRAVLYALLGRSWRAIGGLISILLIAKFLTPETQGYFYTFQSLIALQVFVELGLFVVVVNVTSHEWTRLRLNADGAIVGEPDALSRLVSFGRKLASWYAVAAAVFFLIVAPVGAWFLAQKGGAEGWLGPWLVTVVLQGIVLWTVPFQALFEGCNQVVALQRFQLWQGVFANLVLWTSLTMGAGLWSVAALLGVQAASAIYYLGIRHRSFFLPFRRPSTGPQLDWKREIWPMQWKLALQGVVNYFVYSLYTPVIFHYHGAVEAGRFGMTWQAFNVLQTLSLAWVQVRVPRFGMLVAQRDFAGLDRLWRHMALLATGVFALGMGAFLLFVLALNHLDFELGRRLLTPQITALLLPTGVFATWVQCAALYWRAHKTEPLGFTGAIPGLINGVLVWWLGRQYGSAGAIIAYLAMLTLISVPLAAYLRRRVARSYRAVLDA
jgi:O-antigen/teichoic acid export membrane protein